MLSGYKGCSLPMGSLSRDPVACFMPLSQQLVLVLPLPVLSPCPVPPLAWAGCPQQVWAAGSLKLSGIEGVRKLRFHVSVVN